MLYEGKEVFFDRNDLIVSKTDLTGKLIYTNDIFLNIADYNEPDVIGKQHNVIRNPNMPRVVFKILWDAISAGNEIFAYVVNSTKNGDHYWVIAHVTPSMVGGQVVGYHSTRRVPNPQTIKTVIEPLYDELRNIEQQSSGKKEGIEKAEAALNAILAGKKQTYDEFVASLIKEG